MEKKACNKCATVRLMSMFPKDRTRKTGYKARCKLCTREDRKKPPKVSDIAPECVIYPVH